MKDITALMREHAEYMNSYDEPFTGSQFAVARALLEGSDEIERLRTALAGMVKWFRKYPECVPNPRYGDEIDAVIKAAIAVLEAKP